MENNRTKEIEVLLGVTKYKNTTKISTLFKGDITRNGKRFKLCELSSSMLDLVTSGTYGDTMSDTYESVVLLIGPGVISEVLKRNEISKNLPQKSASWANGIFRRHGISLAWRLLQSHLKIQHVGKNGVIRAKSLKTVRILLLFLKDTIVYRL